MRGGWRDCRRWRRWRRNEVGLPASPHEREPLFLKESIAYRILGRDAHVEEAWIELVSAIDDLEQHRVIRDTHVDRLEYRNQGRVLDPSMRIARRELDILNHLIQGIRRIDVSVRDSVELLILAHDSE